jgi:glyoxylase I family protein
MFSFHHIALTVSDIETSMKFYAIFGLTPVLKWQSDNKDLMIIHLKSGDIFLELFCYSKDEKVLPLSKSDIPKLGIQHFALKVDSIEAAKEFILTAGLAKEENIEIKQGRTGISYFFIKDPDGNWVEIVEDKRVFTKAKI